MNIFSLPILELITTTFDANIKLEREQIRSIEIKKTRDRSATNLNIDASHLTIDSLNRKNTNIKSFLVIIQIYSHLR